jgi:hypothetical protein
VKLHQLTLFTQKTISMETFKKKSIAVIIRFAIFTKLLFEELSIKKFQRAQTFYFHEMINLNPNRSS